MSHLNFQEPAFEVPLRLRSFYGRNVEQMQRLLEGKDENGKVVDIPRTPITVKQLLYERVSGKYEHDRTLLRDNYVNAADVIVVDPEGSGETIIGLYTDPAVKELVHSLCSINQLVAGSLPVSTDQYQEIKKQAFVFAPNVANELRRDPYSQQEFREEFWNYVAEGDTDLVRANLSLVQEVNGGSMKDRMGLYLSSNSGLRLVCVGSVGGISDADGYRGLGLSDGPLVGVAAEPLARENLESKVGKGVV